MNKEEQKSEFAEKLEAIAQDLNKGIEGQNKGFILIGVEENPKEGEEGKTTRNALIAVSGKGGLLVEGLVQFITKPETSDLHNEALKRALMNKVLSNPLD